MIKGGNVGKNEGSLIKLESGNLVGEALLHSLHLADSHKEAYLVTPAGGNFSLYPATAQPMRSHHPPLLLLYSNGLLLITASLNFLFLYTITFAFVLQTCM